MAVTYEGAGPLAFASSATTSLTMSAPAGFSAGDLFIALVVKDDAPAIVLPTGSTWTPIQAGYRDENGPYVSVSYRVAEEGDTDWTWTGDNETWVGKILWYSGQSTSAPINISDIATGDDTAPIAPTVETDTAGCMVVQLFGCDNTRVPGTIPDPLRERVKNGSGGAVQGVTLQGGDWEQSSAGFTGTATFSIDRTDEWVAVTLAIAPEEAAGNQTSDTRDARIAGKVTDGSSSRDARTVGGVTTSSTRDARTEGQVTAASGRDARTAGKITDASSTRDARTAGEVADVSSSRDARTLGEATTTSDRDARTAGQISGSSTDRDARTKGQVTVSSSRAARTEGEGAGTQVSSSRDARSKGQVADASTARAARTAGKVSDAGDTRDATTKGQPSRDSLAGTVTYFQHGTTGGGGTGDNADHDCIPGAYGYKLTKNDGAQVRVKDTVPGTTNDRICFSWTTDAPEPPVPWPTGGYRAQIDVTYVQPDITYRIQLLRIKLANCDVLETLGTSGDFTGTGIHLFEVKDYNPGDTGRFQVRLIADNSNAAAQDIKCNVRGTNTFVDGPWRYSDSDTRDARTAGKVTDSSSARSARTEGTVAGTQTSDSRDARTAGQVADTSDGRAARTLGGVAVSSSRDARTAGKVTDASSSRPARTKGTSSLIGYWPMDDNAASTTVVDSSGFGHDGTFQDATGDPNTASHSVAGKKDRALSFDGIDDYVAGTNLGDISTTELTQVYVIKKLALSGIRRLSNTGTFKCGFTGSTFYVHTETTSGTDFNTPIGGIGMTAGEWHMLVVTRETDADNQVKVYLDGHLKLTGDLVNSANGTMVLGVFNPAPQAQPWDGLIDDVRVYNVAFTGPEVLAHYRTVFGTADSSTRDARTAGQTSTASTRSARTEGSAVPGESLPGRAYEKHPDPSEAGGRIPQAKYHVISESMDERVRAMFPKSNRRR